MRIRRVISVAAVSVLAVGVLGFASPASAVEPASQPPNCTKLLNEIQKYNAEAIHYEKKGDKPRAKNARAKAYHAQSQFIKYC